MSASQASFCTATVAATAAAAAASGSRQTADNKQQLTSTRSRRVLLRRGRTAHAV